MMKAFNKLSKRGLHALTAAVVTLAIASCGGTPPPLPAPPPSNGGFFGGGGGGTCGGITGQVLPGGPFTGTGSNGASVTVNVGVQFSTMSSTVSFYLPDLQGSSSYTQTQPLSTVCLSTTNTSGQQSPGTYSNGYIQAQLYGTVPVQTINTGYGQIKVIGTSYGGAPTTYEVAYGSISGYVNAGSFQGQAQIQIPGLQYYSSVNSGGYGW